MNTAKVLQKAFVAEILLFFIGTLPTPCLAQISNDFSQVVVSYEVPQNKDAPSDQKTVVDIFYPTDQTQLEQARSHVAEMATKALKENKDLSVEYVVTHHEPHANLGVTALNETANKSLAKAKELLAVQTPTATQIMSPSELNEAFGLGELAEHERLVVTKISLPAIPEASQTPPPEKTRKEYTNTILTVVRSITSVGINAFVIYYSIGADLFTPAALPALIFYPFTETAQQLAATPYEQLLKKIKFTGGRFAIQTAISFATIFTHMSLMSSLGIANIAWIGVLPIVFKDAIATQVWWEMAISKNRPQYLKGQYVAFGLGIVGMVGLLLDSVGYALGNYTLYALGISGTILWIQHGAIQTLKNDAQAALKFFQNKSKIALNALRQSCFYLNLRSYVSLLSVR